MSILELQQNVLSLNKFGFELLEINAGNQINMICISDFFSYRGSLRCKY